MRGAMRANVEQYGDGLVDLFAGRATDEAYVAGGLLAEWLTLSRRKLTGEKV
jgi:hypothetical protein